MDTFTIPSVSEMESITRMWNTLIEHRHEFEHGFKQLGNVEYPYSHTRAFNRHAVDVELVHTPITEVVHKPAEQDKPEENKDIKHENILYADETGLDMYVDNKMLVIVTETNVDVSNNILSIN